MELLVRLSDAEGQPLPDGVYDLKLRLLQTTSELPVRATVRDGVLGLALDDVQLQPDDKPTYVEVELDEDVRATARADVTNALGEEPGGEIVVTADVSISGLVRRGNELQSDQAALALTPDVPIWSAHPRRAKPPLHVSSMTTARWPSSIAVWGEYAYIAAKEDGVLQVVDVSNPSTPKALGHVRITAPAPDTPRSPEYVAAAEHLVLVTAIGIDYPSTLVRVDAEEPSQPGIDGTAQLTNGASRIAIGERYAYIASVFGGPPVAICDVRDMHPHVVRGVGVFPGADVRLPFDAIPWDIKIVEKTHAAYLCAGRNGLVVWDISKPTEPRGVGAIELPIDGPSRIALAGNLLITNSTEYQIQVVGIDDPFNPTVITTVPTMGQVHGLALTHGHVVVLGRDRGILQIFDLSDPSDPKLVAENQFEHIAADGRRYSFANLGRPALTVQGRYCYVTSSLANGLDIFDLGPTLGL